MGFGSLLSERSARSTFPNLGNLRVVRVRGFQRVFAHPAAIFFEREIARLQTKEMASLCCFPSSSDEHSFLAVAFEVPVTDESQWLEFERREEEFELVDCEFEELTPASVQGVEVEGDVHKVPQTGEGKPRSQVKHGLICTQGSDELYIQKWGYSLFAQKYLSYGLGSIWNWSKLNSGILPCRLYLRHCVLAATSLGIQQDFLSKTYLVDRTTTIQAYLETNPHVMQEELPLELAERYGG